MLVFMSAKSFSPKTGKFSLVRVLDVSHGQSEPGNAQAPYASPGAVLVSRKA